MTRDDTTVNRRTVLKGAGVAGAVGLAGCLGGGGGEPLEVQHWLTGGDGADAVQALFDGFREEYPDLEITENPVSGGGGENLHTVIKKRILNDNPPSTWQAWPGANLVPYTDAGKLEDIEESVWSQNDMKNAYLDGPKQAAQPAGNYVTVPINIHRLNNLFYNTAVIEDAGVDPSSIESPSDLVAAMEQVEAAGYVGMAQQTGSAWSTGQLFAQVLLGEYGNDTYEAFTEGEISANEDAIKDALSIVSDYSEFYPEDAGSISWTEANEYVINGEAGFFHQGDWAAGMYRSAEEFEYDSDWSQVPFPGTDGMYALNMDSFPFPSNNPSPETTEKFLTYCGTVDAQERFNPKKGSIPPRTDVPKDEFGPFLQNQMDEFANSDAQPRSLQHGLALDPDTLTAFGDAMSTFISEYDVDATYDSLKSAFGE
jgi:glucose/mannose transport system substrate-binding protein